MESKTTEDNFKMQLQNLNINQVEEEKKIDKQYDSEYQVDDFFQSEEELQLNYNTIIQKCREIEDKSIIDAKILQESIKNLKKLEKSIIQQSIFSPNEEFKEIQPENLKYFLLPYYMGTVFGRFQQSRRSNLNISKTYFNEYIRLLNHYKQLNPLVKSLWKDLWENTKNEPSRDEKIESYKKEKALEKKLQDQKFNDDEQKIEYFQILSEIYQYKCLTQLRLINQEVEILEYKEKITNDEKSKQIYQKQLNDPIPPLKFFTIPKNEMIETQQMCSNCKHDVEKKQILYQKVAKLDNRELIGLSEQQIKEEYRSRVFQPGFSQPIQTLDEFADDALKFFNDMEQRNDKANEKNEKQKEELDPDKDADADQQTKKDSEWDNWKDDHEKGYGNRHKNRR